MHQKVLITEILYDLPEAGSIAVAFIIDNEKYYAASDDTQFKKAGEYNVSFLEDSGDTSIEKCLGMNPGKEKKMEYKGDAASAPFCSKYDCYGEIISIEPLILDCGNLKIEIEIPREIPESAGWNLEDFYKGRFIYWDVEKLIAFNEK